jgi:hypothetical protein
MAQLSSLCRGQFDLKDRATPELAAHGNLAAVIADNSSHNP